MSQTCFNRIFTQLCMRLPLVAVHVPILRRMAPVTPGPDVGLFAVACGLVCLLASQSLRARRPLASIDGCSWLARRATAKGVKRACDYKEGRARVRDHVHVATAQRPAASGVKRARLTPGEGVGRGVTMCHGRLTERRGASSRGVGSRNLRPHLGRCAGARACRATPTAAAGARCCRRG